MKTLIAILLLGVMAVCPVVAETATETTADDLPVRVNHSQTWQGTAGSTEIEVRTLTVTDWMPDRALTRVLINDDDTRLVLDEERFLLEGTSRFTLRDASTGWWLELTAHSGLVLESIDQAADPGQIAIGFSNLVADDYEGSLALRAQGLPEVVVPARLWRDDAYLRFARRLEADEHRSTLVNNVPAPTRETLRRLASLVRTGDAGAELDNFGGLLAALELMLDADPVTAPVTPRPPLRWRLVDTEFVNGDDLATRQAQFTDAFGLSTSDPVADLRDNATPISR
ncbi:MAG: hypothetical protein AAGD38_19325 [Acidobacteriota bacterium]